MFELVTTLLLRSSHSLLTTPWGHAGDEEALVQEALPPPVFEGNFESQLDTCLMMDKFKEAASAVSVSEVTQRGTCT